MGAVVSERSVGATVQARAARLEAEAAAFPEQRGMLLLEAARAGRGGGAGRAAA